MKVILADKYPIFRNGLSTFIKQHSPFDITAIVGSTDELIHAIETHTCDLVIMDCFMPKQCINDGLHLLSYLQRHFPKLRIIVFTANTLPAMLHQIIHSGVNALLDKSDSEDKIHCALQNILHQKHYISPTIQTKLTQGYCYQAETKEFFQLPSPRETEVLRMYIASNSLQEIASRLHKSVKTVGTQKLSAMKKLGLRNDVELGRYFEKYKNDGCCPYTWQCTQCTLEKQKKAG